MSDGSAFLEQHHLRFTGATRRIVGAGRVDGGGTSYQALAALVPEGASGVAVVDLGCGDGELLVELTRRVGPDCRLVGVDASMAELAAASARPELAGCHFVREDVQDLTLPPRMVDFALAHLLLMLVDDVEATIAAVARTLKRGGLFGAIVGMSPVPTDDWQAFGALVGDADVGQVPELGEPRARSEAGLRALLEPTFEDVRTRGLTLDLSASPDEAWARLSRLYLLGGLHEEGRERLRAVFSERFGGRERLELRFGLVEATGRLPNPV
jgi:ubiquinone/menaquinone biosynthesis C-methylase UbiE